MIIILSYLCALCFIVFSQSNKMATCIIVSMMILLLKLQVICFIVVANYFPKQNIFVFNKMILITTIIYIHDYTQQTFRCDNNCTEAVKSVEIVTSCPTSKQEWSKAASKKNCGKMAAQQTCTVAKNFLYHCVINGFQNETLEVCAPQKLIIGFNIFLYLF